MARFRTKARAVDLLGKQQIRDEVTAISELLRNSYDADASEGLIDVSLKEEYIMVWDDGDGMNESDLINNWLTIGTYSKAKASPIRTTKRRIKIGEKGIGRLAISLLGNQLLVVSKKRFENEWSLLYLHWGLFRNEKLFLEDIEIPTKSFESLAELKQFLDNNFRSLKDDLIKNLKNNNKWDEKEASRIFDEISHFSISNDMYKRIQLNEFRGGGTTFFIKNIENDWDWELYKSNIEDESRKERKRRLQNVLVSFSNLIDLFDNKEDENNIDGFTPRIHIDGLKLERESWFNPEDIELYDYALKGRIEKGIFTGQVYVRNSSDTDVYDVSNIELTTGIHTSSMTDCGPIDVKWFFIEGRNDQTSLSKEQLQMMRDKLSDSGGIYVFRDGLRILPYGEPGNDFLKIEERRSKGAGYYLFSHRRMYGFIEISKFNNRDLIDKSSREGFVENTFYKYFIAVSQNLLVWWARDFFESQKEFGLRQQRIKRLQEDRERDKRMIKQQREEELRERAYFRALEEALNSFQKELDASYNRIKHEIQTELELRVKKIKYNCNSIQEYYDKLFYLKMDLYKLTAKLDELKVPYNSRYFHLPEIVDQIDHTESQINIYKVELEKFVEDSIDRIEKPIFEEEKNNNDDKTDLLISRITQTISWKDDVFQSLCDEVISTHLNAIRNEVISTTNKIIQDYESKIQDRQLHFIQPIQMELQESNNRLKNVLEKMHTFDYIIDPITVEDEVNTALGHHEDLMLKAHQELLQLSSEIKSLEITRNLQHFLKETKDKLQSGASFFTDDDFIGFLKKEVIMYRDLSSIGLAAELTSHEFNALYSSIHENINVLYKSLSKTKALPVIEKTRNAFKSLERLHQRMSPLYRQARARKEKIILDQFIRNVLEYFESDLRRYNILIHIRFSESFTIKENEAVLFTPIVNIISNSIYWLLNRENKEIYFYVSNNNKLYIHDTGPGIPIKDQTRIFEPFFTRKVEGRGLGLFLSRDILESRGHKLYLINPGEELLPLSGACFCIEFNTEAFGDDI